MCANALIVGFVHLEHQVLHPTDTRPSKMRPTLELDIMIEEGGLDGEILSGV